MADYERVADTPDFGPGTQREVQAQGETLVLVNVGQTYYALQAHCPRDGTNLATEGRLKGDRLICPADDWAFDVTTGKRVAPEGGPELQRYDIRVEGNGVLIGPALPSE